jgi:hypothetical protein
MLCGQKSGLTVQCDHSDCHYIINGERVPAAFHVTCARSAGLEVGSTDDGAEHLYGTRYVVREVMLNAVSHCRMILAVQ